MAKPKLHRPSFGRLRTGLHNDEIELIYMNARYYVPSIGRFASADTIVPDPTNPQTFNRFSYVYNNPINLIDPSGHCGGDPNNHNLFNSDGGIHLDCTLDNFQNSPIAQRAEWIKAFMDQSAGGQANDWFNNIMGIIQGFSDYGLSDPGTWLSYVDAGILHSIQDGYQLNRGRISSTSTDAEAAAKAWQAFFDDLYDGRYGNSHLITLWGKAEALGTTYGIDYADKNGLAANGFENFFLFTGDIYRYVAGSEQNYFGLLGGMVGASSGVGGFINDLSVEPLVGGATAGYHFGTGFNDPRTLWYGTTPPVYWYSTKIWFAQASWQTAGQELLGGR